MLAGEGWQRDARWAIQDILENRHEYFVQGAFGVLRPVGVVNGPHGQYLRTFADSTEGNNLDNLPEFDPNPWEVALDDSEILAIHAALVLHGVEGQVLMFGGDEHDPGNASSGEIFNTRIYDVASNTMINVDSPEADVFCCGHAFLGDGRLFVGGGTEFWREGVDFDNPDQHDHFDAHAQPRDHWSGARECARYNLDGTWTPRAEMLPEPNTPGDGGGGRWYPTLLTLSDGRILAVGGHPRLSDTRHGAWLPEIYDPATDSWTYQSGHWIYVDWADVPVERELETHEINGNEVQLPTGDPILDNGELIELREFPDGQIRPTDNPDSSVNYLYYPRIYTVPGGIFMASPNDFDCGWYDIETGLIIGHRINRPFSGIYAETNHTAVLLPLLPDDGYRGHVLLLGNGGAHRISFDSPDSAQAPEWVESERTWTIDPPLRRHGCATLMPTGQVLFSGGINQEGASGLLDENAVLQAEVYTPGIDWEANQITFAEEDWEPTAAANVPRNYHSVALLLPNGRVLTAGSNINGSQGGDNVKEYRVEIYTPDWFHDVNRPEISNAPTALNYGETFEVDCTRASQIQRAALMRCGSVTHAWDGDQRYIGLALTRLENGLRLIAPPDGSVAPPGPYMLWIVDFDNRPCRLAPFVILN